MGGIKTRCVCEPDQTLFSATTNKNGKKRSGNVRLIHSIRTVQLDLNLKLASEVHVCICDSFRVFLKNSRVCTVLHVKLPCITRYEQRASRMTRSCNYSKYAHVCVTRRCESNLKMGRIFIQTHAFVLIDSVSFHTYQITVPADKHVLATLNY